MASAPQTWNILTKIRDTIQAEVLVGGVSPFTAFTAADATAYGATNAIYIGPPKDQKPIYATECWIIPPKPDNPYRRALGGKIWQEQHIKIVTLSKYTTAYFTVMQTHINTVDALVPVLLRHCDSTWGSTCAAAKPVEGTGGYGYLNSLGEDWLQWQIDLWIKQEFNIAGGIVA